MENHKKLAIRSMKVIGMFILVFAISSVLLIKLVIDQHIETSQRSLYEVAIRSQKMIKNRLKRDLNEIDTIAYILSINRDESLNSMIDFVREDDKMNSFKRIAFIGKDGVGYEIKSGEIYNLPKDMLSIEWIQKGFNGETILSHTEKDKGNVGNVNYYVKPVENEEGVFGVVVGVIDNSILTNIIASTTLGIDSITRIIESSTGELVTGNELELDKVAMDEEDFKCINEKIKNTKDNVFSCKLKQGEMLVTYIPMDINDWILLSVVPEKFAIEKYDYIVGITAVCIAIIIAGFCALIYCIIKIEKSKDEEILNLAYYDRVTGAFNKDKFKKEACMLMDDRKCNYAVAFIDIVNFKLINEIFTYENGNKFLKYIAKVISENIGEDEIYFRNNDDKFGVLLKLEDEEILLERLRNIGEQIKDFPIKKNQKYNIMLKFGIYVIEYNKTNIDFEICIDRAQMALVKAKKSYNNQYEFYDEDMHKSTIMKHIVENNIEQALEAKGFSVYLQPKYDLAGETISGAEALVRWNNEQYGMMSPNMFIPIFEENGFIIQLDRYVLRRVCRMINQWKEKGYPLFPISVNQSRINFYQEEYIDELKNIIETENIDPKMIIIEITENVVIENFDTIKDTVEKLRELGFAISMDDFGSGYSSLNILKNLFIDELKLDKKFLENSSDSYREEKIIAKIIDLAKALSIKTVSEGVETERQVHFLKSVGCDIGQGYFFSKPIPIDEFEAKIFKKS